MVNFLKKSPRFHFAQLLFDLFLFCFQFDANYIFPHFIHTIPLFFSLYLAIFNYQTNLLKILITIYHL